MNRSWRLVATAALFVTFGVGGLLAGLTVFPMIALVSPDPVVRTRRARAVVRASFRAFLWLMQVLRVARLDIEAGASEALGSERGTVVVANHPTLLDVVILLALVDQANCVVKSALWRNPFLRWGVRAASYIPNDDLETLMAACEKTLREGQTLIVFPEATRTVPGQPIRLHKGAAKIATRAEAAIRVVHLRCEPSTLSKNEPWYRIPTRQPCFSLRVGGSLPAHHSLREVGHFNTAARRLTQALKEELSRDILINESPGDRAEAASD